MEVLVEIPAETMVVAEAAECRHRQRRTVAELSSARSGCGLPIRSAVTAHAPNERQRHIVGGTPFGQPVLRVGQPEAQVQQRPALEVPQADGNQREDRLPAPFLPAPFLPADFLEVVAFPAAAFLAVVSFATAFLPTAFFLTARSGA